MPDQNYDNNYYESDEEYFYRRRYTGKRQAMLNKQLMEDMYGDDDEYDNEEYDKGYDDE